MNITSIINKVETIGEYSTPIKIANDMLKLLDEVGFFSKPQVGVSWQEYVESHRVLDIYCKSGVFLDLCYHRFMIEKDKEEVKKVQVQSIDSLKAKFANLKFGK